MAYNPAAPMNVPRREKAEYTMFRENATTSAEPMVKAASR
jgi:hypothetical protein